jgi:D-alanyl-D-alanine carboxypeptidase
MRPIRLVLAVLLVAFSSTAAAAQTVPPNPADVLIAGDPPMVTAKAWILWDDTFGQVLAESSPDERLPMASVTKMMTALVVLENAELDDLVEITMTADDVGESEIGLVAGEDPWTVQDLVTALLVRSANDAAVALAEHVGGSVEGFADMMNLKAFELGMENSHFVNPHGLDDPDHYSSARDLLTLARAGLENPTFAQLVQLRSARMPDNPETGAERIAIATNKLLDTYPGTIGVKTGFTDLAGLSMAAAAERDGRRLYAVVLGSEDHFLDVARLLDYGFAEFGIVQLVAAGDAYANRRVADLLTPAVASESFDLFIGNAEAEAVDIVPQFEGEVPVLVAELDGQEIGRVALDLQDAPGLPGLSDALSWAGGYWDWLWGNS